MLPSYLPPFFFLSPFFLSFFLIYAKEIFIRDKYNLYFPPSLLNYTCFPYLGILLSQSNQLHNPGIFVSESWMTISFSLSFSCLFFPFSHFGLQYCNWKCIIHITLSPFCSQFFSRVIACNYYSHNSTFTLLTVLFLISLWQVFYQRALLLALISIAFDYSAHTFFYILKWVCSL